MTTHRVDSVVLVPTLRCNFKCGHCLRGSSPRTTGFWKPEVIERLRSLFWLGAFREAADVTISGGEPFIMRPQEWQAVLGVLPDRVNSISIITNGSWTKNDKLRKWNMEHVIFELNRRVEDMFIIELSRDQYHRDEQTFDVDFHWNLMVSEYKEGFARHNAKGDPEDDDYYDRNWFFDPDAERVSFGKREGSISPEHVIPVGRGKAESTLAGKYMKCGFDRFPEDEDRTWGHQITVDPNGNVLACCDSQTVVGNIFDLDAAFRNKVRLYKHMLHDYKSRGGSRSVTHEGCFNCKRVGARVLARERGRF